MAICSKSEQEFWIHPVTARRDCNSFLAELKHDPAKFYNYCRMSVNTFDHLLDIADDKIQKRDTNCRRSISPEDRLLITLR